MMVSFQRNVSLDTNISKIEEYNSNMGQRRQGLIEQAGFALQAYQRSSQAFDDAVGRALGLNATDLRCLDWLADGPKTAGQLAQGTGLSSAATTALIDRLEGKGYVRRVADPADRRRVLVEMSPSGVERVGGFYGPLVREGTKLFDGVTSAEIARMRDWLVAARTITDQHRDQIRSASAVAADP
jgi:DNA-binding MarR family transcriptional regulator